MLSKQPLTVQYRVFFFKFAAILSELKKVNLALIYIVLFLNAIGQLRVLYNEKFTPRDHRISREATTFNPFNSFVLNNLSALQTLFSITFAYDGHYLPAGTNDFLQIPAW